MHSDKDVCGSVRLCREAVGLKSPGDEIGVLHAVRSGIDIDCGRDCRDNGSCRGGDCSSCLVGESMMEIQL